MINVFLFIIVFSLNSLFGSQGVVNLRLSEIQEILGPPHKTLKDQNRRDSCAKAYDQLDKWMDDRILRAEAEDIVQRLKNFDKRNIFLTF